MFLSVELDRRAGEADERGVRQRVAQVAGEAVDEVVLAAVRLVGDDDDVRAVAEQRVRLAALVGHELLDRREDDAAGGDLQLGAQVVAALGLHRLLPQQLVAVGERAEELVVEVVAVGEHDQRRVRHLRLLHELAGVEGHREALAAALGVPDDADAVVAGRRPRRWPRPPC